MILDLQTTHSHSYPFLYYFNVKLWCTFYYDYQFIFSLFSSLCAFCMFGWINRRGAAKRIRIRCQTVKRKRERKYGAQTILLVFELIQHQWIDFIYFKCIHWIVIWPNKYSTCLCSFKCGGFTLSQSKFQFV